MDAQKPYRTAIVEYTESGGTFPAIVTRVHSPTVLNLTVFPDGQQPFTVESVPDHGTPHWSWPTQE